MFQTLDDIYINPHEARQARLEYGNRIMRSRSATGSTIFTTRSRAAARSRL
jgi:hypothetical protein